MSSGPLPGPGPRWRLSAAAQRRVLYAALVFALAVLAYLPALANGFAYDDVVVVARDPRVTTFDVRAILSGGYWANDARAGLYRPLVTLSFALDWQISGGAPAWFYFINALLHGAASVLLLQLLCAVRAPVGPALLGAAVFAVHPVHVEAVANTVGRAELLASCFVLAAALLWVRRARLAPSAAALALLLGCFALALLSKESAVVLPGLLVLVDMARGRLRADSITHWLKLRLVPLTACAVVLAVFFGVRAAVLDSTTPTNLDTTLDVLDSGRHRLYTALQTWPQYARLLFYPRVLLADYTPRIMLPATAVDASVALGAIILATCVLGGCLAWARRRFVLAAALLWFPVAIFPASNLVVPIGVLLAERTMYLPSVALSLGIVAAAGLLSRGASRARAPGLALAAVAGVVLGLLAARTVSRIPDWRSTSTIIHAVLRDRPDSYRATWYVARIAANRGQSEDAMRQYARAIGLWPHRLELIRETALYAQRWGRREWSKNLTSYATEQWPEDLVARRLRAGLLLDDGDTAGARLQVQEGLKWHPQDSLLRTMLQATTPSAAERGSGRE